MQNVERVIDFFRDHVEKILKDQSPHTWCEDDERRELLWEVEQEISDFNNANEGRENFEHEFESQHVETYDQAEQLVIELNRSLNEKWDFIYPFVTTHNARANAFEDLLILAWDITYILETELGRLFVNVKTKGHEIKVIIDEKIIGEKNIITQQFDLFNDLERQLIIFNLTQKG